MPKQKSWITAVTEAIEEENQSNQSVGRCPTCGAEETMKKEKKKKQRKSAVLNREAVTLKRSVTALSVEHELLTSQVAEMRRLME